MKIAGIGEGEDKPGYTVVYPDGYTSWSPADVFEKAYIEIGDVAHMPPHQQRVVGEAAELRDKLAKLRTFLDGKFFTTLPIAEQGRLIAQATFMNCYHDTLNDRIAAF